MTEVEVYHPQKHHSLAPSIVNIHTASSLEDHRTVMGFLPPFTQEKRETMLNFWEDRLSRARGDSTDTMVLAFSEDETGQKTLSGVVVLNKPVTESGPFRAYVQNLLVSPNFRRQGIATKMMRRLEEVAKAEGRTLLVSVWTDQRLRGR